MKWLSKRLFSYIHLSTAIAQRKNGLFKKAYELGVLCSVDVAVIIFGQRSPSPRPVAKLIRSTGLVYLYLTEERPGHHVKLYQYCSGNVEEIVQRHAKVSRGTFLLLSIVLIISAV